jgi:hypothetical protein
MLKENVPPMSAENMAGMLRLQSERDFSIDTQDLAVDFCAGESADPGSRPVLIVATLRDRVNQIQALLKVAGVSLRALTSSALALSEAAGADQLMSAGPFGAELIVRSRGGLRIPRTCPRQPMVRCGSCRRQPPCRTMAMRAVDPGTSTTALQRPGKDGARRRNIRGP